MNKSTFEAYFNSPSVGLFKDNTTQDRVPEQDRDLVTKVKENVFFLEDNAFNGAQGFQAPASSIAGFKAIPTLNLPYGVVVMFPDGGASDLLRVYQLKNSTTEESSPELVRPNDYNDTTNHKVWKLLFTESTVTGINGGTL